MFFLQINSALQGLSSSSNIMLDTMYYYTALQKQDLSRRYLEYHDVVMRMVLYYVIYNLGQNNCLLKSTTHTSIKKNDHRVCEAPPLTL